MTDIDPKAVIKGEVLSAETFVKLVLSNPLRGKETPYVRVTVRPVLIRDERHLQFSYFDGERDIAKNYRSAEAEARLEEVLDLPFGQANILSAAGDLEILVGRKGNVHVTRGAPTHEEIVRAPSHDRQKQHPLPVGDPLLRTLGIVTKKGKKIRAARRGKFAQINEFLRIIDQLLPEDTAGPLHIVDCGCGQAYLTFAAFHYLTHRRRIPARAVGIDSNPDRIATCRSLLGELGWTGIEFRTARIAEFEPDERPDVTLSLHACDTATDEAIALGCRWRSAAILAAPCCQHELHDRIDAEAMQPILRYGILRERLADIVTDTFRALALRISGYRTNVEEFVSAESTSKNLMIRAEAGLDPGDPRFVEEYNRLKRFWAVTPAIEELLGARFAHMFDQCLIEL
ncbi:MAG: class I SAM-dependent methyltransferase, partial [Planctomycetota bacterium]